MPISRRDFSGKLIEKSAGILSYFKDFEGNLAVRVSGGDLGEAEAPTDAAAEKAAAETDRKVPGGEAVGNALGVPPAISTRDKNRALFLSVYTTPESCFFKMRRGTE